MSAYVYSCPICAEAMMDPELAEPFATRAELEQHLYYDHKDWQMSKLISEMVRGHRPGVVPIDIKERRNPSPRLKEARK